MKTPIAVLTALLAGATFADATIPLTSEAQNAISPPASGKMAYRLADGSSAILYIGANGAAIPIGDPAALRANRVGPYDEALYDIDWGTATVVELNGQTCYKADSGATITITMLNGEPISEAQIASDYSQGGGMMPPSLTQTATINGSTATITVKTSNGALMTGALVYPPTTSRVNDTNVQDFTIKDILGTYRLSLLRSELINYHNGNRGEDWAKYPAAAQIRTAGNEIYFGDTAGATIRPGDAALAVSVLSRDVLTIQATRGADVPETGTITITDLDIGDTAVTLTATLDGVDPSSVSLYSATELEAAFVPTAATVADKGSGSYAFTVARGAEEKTHFYQLRADGGIVSAAVRIHGDLEVSGDLILSSPNGTRWRVTVSDAGALTATEVAE